MHYVKSGHSKLVLHHKRRVFHASCHQKCRLASKYVYHKYTYIPYILTPNMNKLIKNILTAIKVNYIAKDIENL